MCLGVACPPPQLWPGKLPPSRPPAACPSHLSPPFGKATPATRRGIATSLKARGASGMSSPAHNPTTSSQARSITPPRRISRSGGGPRGDQPKGNMPHALTPEPTSQETTASRRPKARRQRERKAAERQQSKATKQGQACRIQTGTHPRNWTQKGTTTTQNGNRQKNRRSNSQPTCAAF